MGPDPAIPRGGVPPEPSWTCLIAVKRHRDYTNEADLGNRGFGWHGIGEALHHRSSPLAMGLVFSSGEPPWRSEGRDVN